MVELRSSLVAIAIAVVAAPHLSGVAMQSALDFGGYRPHYQGHGVTTRGGRGGAIYVVTHLNDTLDVRSPLWQGSFRRAATASGARFVVFEVSGTIALVSEVVITAPFLTIAGQTAPSPGITVRDRPIIIDAHDVVVQHMRLRLGDLRCVNNCAAGGSAALYLRNNVFNVVLDHLSVSWGTQGGLAIHAWSGASPREVAVLDSIVAENLAKPSNPFGIGTLFMPAERGTATFARNLHAHNGNRNPWVSPGWRLSGYNNVAYNAGSVARDEGALGFFQFMGGYGYGHAADIVWMNNVAIAGPDTHADGRAVKVDLHASDTAAGHRLYMAGNLGPHQTTADQWRGVTFLNAASEHMVRSPSPPPWHEAFGYAVLATPQVTEHVLNNAGARPLDRDVVDARIVMDVMQRTGRRITNPLQVGGYPPQPAARRALSVPAGPHAIVDRIGRTRVETWLEGLARAVEPPKRAAAAPWDAR